MPHQISLLYFALPFLLQKCAPLCMSHHISLSCILLCRSSDWCVRHSDWRVRHFCIIADALCLSSISQDVGIAFAAAIRAAALGIITG